MKCMKKQGKIFFSLLLMLSLIMGIFPVAYGEATINKSDIIFDMNFEDYKEGEKLPLASGDIYSSAVNNNPKVWSSSTENCIFACTEEEGMNNKVVRAGNSTDNNIETGFSKMLRIEEGYSSRFSLSFRVNPNGNNARVPLRRYGGTNATVNLFSMETSGDVTINGKKVTSVSTNKWTSYRFDVYIPENMLFAYVDSQLVYMGEYHPNNFVDNGTYYQIQFTSTVSAQSFTDWDDIMIANLDEQTEVDNVATGDNLEKYKGVHPRLFFTEEDFEKAKETIKTEKAKDEWEALKAHADKLVERGAAEYVYGGDISEDAWMRTEATYIEQLCFAYKITGEEKYKTAAKEFVEKAISYPSWGNGEAYKDKDLAASHMIKAISCYYDWLYNDMDANDRYVVYKTLVDKVPKLRGWWTMSYLQNHLWRNAGAWYAAAVAIYDEYQGAADWFAQANQWYKLIVKYLPDDGCDHESFMYWVYGMDGFMAYANNAPKFHNVNLFEYPFFKKTANYAMEVILPTSFDGLNNKIYRIADHGDVTGTEWVGLMAWLATKNQDSVAQWWVDKYSDLYTTKKEDYAVNYIMYYDFDLDAMSPEEAKRPLNYLFEDLDMFFMRSDYSDYATCVQYRCGPPLGWKPLGYYSSGDIGSGHEHYDVNALQIYAYGEHLLGETQYLGNSTSSHSTLLIDNRGQESPQTGNIKGAVWNKNPEIVKIEENENYVYSVGRGTDAYDFAEEYGLNWDRHFVWLKNNVLIVVDDIELANDEVVTEQRWWPESQNGKMNADGSYVFTGKATNLKIRPFITESDINVEYGSADKYFGPVTNGATPSMLVNVKSNGTSVVPTALSWSKADEEPVDIGCENVSEGVYKFYTYDKVITVDINQMKVELSDIREGFQVRKNLVFTETDALPENVNDRFYISESDIQNLTDATTVFDETTGVLSLESKFGKAQMKIGDSSYIYNGVSVPMDATPYINADNKAMFPVKYVGICTGVGAEWKEDMQVLSLTTDVDFENVELKALNVCGKAISMEKGKKDYEVQVFADNVTIAATAVNPFADVKFELCEGGFGKSKIYITNPDGTKVNEYTINTIATSGIGNIPVYNMSYSSTDGNLGENVFDSSYDTRWSAQGLGQWLKMDLREIRKVKSIMVSTYLGNTRKTAFDIEISSDGENWTKVNSFMTSGKTNEAEEYKLDVETRWIRFVGNGVNGEGGWNSITEIGLISAE